MKGVATSSVERAHLGMQLPKVEEYATSTGGVAVTASVGGSIVSVGARTLIISST